MCGDFTWRMSEREELVVIAQRSESHFLKLNGTEKAHFWDYEKVIFSVIRWYDWRTSRDSNPEPTD